eukprot:g16533.t1
MLVLGFTMFVVALNMRHYSTTCDTQSARDAALNRAAMERRIKALETEILQNSVFLEKVLQGLDAAFQASAYLSVKELREMAQEEASEIGQRRSRQPPPPMSAFARERVANAVDGGRLQDLVEKALGSETSSSYGGEAGEDTAVWIDGAPREAGGGGDNQGWEWGPTEPFTDDFLDKNEVKIMEPVKLDISEEERHATCNRWLKDHGVTPRVDWGTLPAEDQKLWTQYRCDEVVSESTAAEPAPPASMDEQPRLLAREASGGGDGTNGAAATAGRPQGDGSETGWRGEGGRGVRDAATEDAEAGRLDKGLSGGAEEAAVGVGDVHPICDPSSSECISSDEQVQDELLAELDADDQITAAAREIELGELLCDSLDEASGSSQLRFAMSSTETVTAERTSYTEYDGDVFSDSNDRKVWRGDVVDPAPPAGTTPRTVSMGWAIPCDVETFTLKMVGTNPDGTTSVTTTIPCEAGSSTDICIMQYDIDLPDSDEPLVPDPPSSDDRRLTDLTLDEEGTAVTVQDRRLQSTVRIDVLVVYSASSLSRVVGGVTAAQMESLISDEIPTVNEAVTNSEIDLHYNLVHTALLPYAQASTSSLSELSTLRENSAVAAMRNQYSADLVLLVGNFPGTCGLGSGAKVPLVANRRNALNADGRYALSNPQPWAESYAFSLIDARCFDGKSTTHEIGHNMGCYHDEANNAADNLPNDYSHGLRYCTGDVRFITVMAYYCYLNPPPGFSWATPVASIRYFSNPDVSYMNVPTGTAQANNAKVIRDNMGIISDFRAGAASCTDDSQCDTDNGEICCPVKQICEEPVSPGACGDPHMTGFRGQRFDFTGEDDAWYAVLDDGPPLQINMRVTSPVPDLPEITYITGISVMTTGEDGLQHTIIIQVTDPYSLDSACPMGVSPCLADGALTVEIDGEESLLAPGAVSLAPDVAISAVNLPGGCRSFGFEKYWERKRLEYAQVGGRKLGVAAGVEAMADWILGDPTATNMAECIEYVAAAGESGLFDHESEHASFKILTPLGTVRLNHGRLHQLPMRDPTDQFDLPEHLTWQMNLAIEHDNVSLQAKGILGETLVPTEDEFGRPIMHGMEAIRGKEEDYRVEGALHASFAQGQPRQ